MAISLDSERYLRSKSAVFCSKEDRYWDYSNFAGQYPLTVNGNKIYSSEALFQACRFPARAEVQEQIIKQTGGRHAKMVAKKNREHTRTDWDDYRIDMMRWCLRVKLAQNWSKFSKALLKSGRLPIVEESRKRPNRDPDTFWGTKAVDEEVLEGQNILGKLLVELREDCRQGEEGFRIIQPINIPDFLLSGRPIEPVELKY